MPDLPIELQPSPDERVENARLQVIVGMSGGVDSSVSALLLKAQGYRVTGVFMQNWEDDDEHCTARQDYRDAAAVASRLDMPLTTVNFAEEYWARVFAHFLEEYSAGRTPNPDILCNREIKFRAFLDHARTLGADRIATGHYVRRGPLPAGAPPDRAASAVDEDVGMDNADDNATLLRGLDTNKDQSYFLHTLDRSQLAPALFPVGRLEKPTVRALARDAGFLVHGKKDSTGICFIGERKFRSFLAEYLPAQSGDIIDEAGRVLGRHDGLMFHTLGQRQGLRIGGVKGSDEAPWYVLHKDLEANRLVVGQGHDHPRLLQTSLSASAAHWIAGSPPARDFRCTAKVRYRQDDSPCRVRVGGDGRLEAHFDEPVRAATPGQSIVLYDGPICLGGGIITELAANPCRHSAEPLL